MFSCSINSFWLSSCFLLPVCLYVWRVKTFPGRLFFSYRKAEGDICRKACQRSVFKLNILFSLFSSLLQHIHSHKEEEEVCTGCSLLQQKSPVVKNLFALRRWGNLSLPLAFLELLYHFILSCAYPFSTTGEIKKKNPTRVYFAELTQIWTQNMALRSKEG